MAHKQNLLEIIRSRGHKLTHQRRLVLDILETAQEHLDADMVYVRARERDPHISLATIYRSLALFKEAGLIEQHQLGENHGHFETVQGEPHYHFQCQECGQVIEFHVPRALELVRAHFEHEGSEVNHIHLNIYGRCANCVQRKNPPMELIQDRMNNDADIE